MSDRRVLSTPQANTEEAALPMGRNRSQGQEGGSMRKFWKRASRPFEVVIAWTACAIFGHRVRAQGFHFSAEDLNLHEGAQVTTWPARPIVSPCLRCGRTV